MIISELLDILNEISPFELQEKWDSCGLNVGSKTQEVGTIYLSLDVTKELIEELAPNSVLITHHPIFQKENTFITDNYPYSIISEMIKKNIVHIALHTNFDQTHLNRYVCSEVLGFEIVDERPFLLTFEVNQSFDDFVADVRAKIGLDYTKTIQSHEHIKTATLCTGSGASMIPMVTSDCYLTGDMKYHDALAAKENGLSIIDIGHYESERYFAEILSKELKNYEISAIIINSKNPFTY
jgi:dinuclear metal center YbgI/SA1388 family protein